MENNAHLYIDNNKIYLLIYFKRTDKDNYFTAVFDTNDGRDYIGNCNWDSINTLLETNKNICILTNEYTDIHDDFKKYISLERYNDLKKFSIDQLNTSLKTNPVIDK